MVYVNETSSMEKQIPYSNSFRIFLLLLYSVVFLFGLVGNAMTCYAVIIFRTMRRSIHFYLFNLAVADLLLLFLYVPTQMSFVSTYMDWNMGKDMCNVAFGCICLCLSASIGTLIAISVDRYIGLRRPFEWHAASSRHSWYIIPSIWVLSGATAFPLAYYANIGVNQFGRSCYEAWPDARYEMAYWSMIMTIQYILPLLLITALHVHMTFIIRDQRHEEIKELHKRMIRMVILLLFTYSICNGMQHVNFYLSIYLQIHTKPFGNYLFFISNFAISLQAAINPLIYGISRNDYKTVFKALLKKNLVLKVLFCNKENNGKISSDQTMVTVVETPLLRHKQPENNLLQPEADETAETCKHLKENGINSRQNDKGIISRNYDDNIEQDKRFLQVPKRASRRVQNRFDTLRYVTDEQYQDHLIKAIRKRNKQTDDLSTNHMVTQVITANQNHPFIIVTEFENNVHSEAKGSVYGTIRENDYPTKLNTYEYNKDKKTYFWFEDYRLSKWFHLLNESPESNL